MELLPEAAETVYQKPTLIVNLVSHLPVSHIKRNYN